MTRARRYVGWLERRAAWIAIAAAVLVAASGYLVAFHLPLDAAFSCLLPADAPSVRAMAELGRRMPARDTALMVVVAADPARRAEAAAIARARLAAISPDLIERVESDDEAMRAFVRAHEQLYVPIADLARARDALREQIAIAKRNANPLFVDLDDDDGSAASHALDELRAKRADARARLDRPGLLSADGASQAFVIHTAFVATDVDRDRRLQHALDAIAVELRVHDPTVQVGFAGGVATTLAEHAALVRGVALSTVITALLVALVLYVHLRSLRAIALLVGNIAAATLVAFGAAALTVGHLNAATAFLGAIIAGNGVNYGILLIARYSEERGAHADARDALAVALAGTLRPTLVASLAAAIAYGALGATAFRGFADFALIGSIGMLVCWIASFVVLPLAILKLAPSPRRPVSPLFGRVVARVFGFRNPAAAVAISGLLLAGAGAIAWHYLAHDPYEYDMTHLHSRAPDAREARAWLRYSDRTFGRGLAGLASQTYLAVDRAEDVPGVVEQLHELAHRDPVVGQVRSILDLVPADQPERLALLRELRGLVDQAAPDLDDARRAALLELRPPDTLAPITAADLPRDVAAGLRERDGQIGRAIAVKPGAAFDEDDGRDLIAFADALRGVHARGLVAAGGSLLFADVLLQIRHDGPRVTVLAALGLVVMVLLVVGPSRRGAAVLVAATAGSLGMVAACALAGLRIDFLDFVALPITLGLGIDYAVNVAERAGQTQEATSARGGLWMTGGTVLVCSLTTIIGYASLLVSDNLAIRGFGLASLLGEITCVVAALAIVPSLMALAARGRADSAVAVPLRDRAARALR